VEARGRGNGDGAAGKRSRQLKISDTSRMRIPGARRRAVLGWVLEGATLGGLAAMVAMSAVITKEVQTRGIGGGLAALAAVDPAVVEQVVAEGARAEAEMAGAEDDEPAIDPLVAEGLSSLPVATAAELAAALGLDVSGAVKAGAGSRDGAGAEEGESEFEVAPIPEGMEGSLEIRWFNGRPVRPAKTMWMRVTAYSPDERSCPGTADGITASLHSVFANGMKLVAADSRVLPLGSMITVPGYAGDQIVPVLDRGGKIKGNRLDVLFPTHESARKWGVRRLKVTVWEYADGKGPEEWRKIRDSKR